MEMNRRNFLMTLPALVALHKLLPALPKTTTTTIDLNSPTVLTVMDAFKWKTDINCPEDMIYFVSEKQMMALKVDL